MQSILRNFPNDLQIPKGIILLRLLEHDEDATCETFEYFPLGGGQNKFVAKIRSVLENSIIEEALSFPATQAETNKLLEIQNARADLRSEYENAIATLTQIRDANPASVTPAQVVAAVQYIAKVLLFIIKLLARLV